jgi:Family of unknown function (DUF5335)
MSEFIEQTQWKSFLEAFSKRHESRATRLEIVGDVGAQEQEEFLPLVGVSFESIGSAAGTVAITLGRETVQDPRRLEHLVSNIKRIAPVIGPDGFEEGLAFEDEDGGKVILTFEKLVEIPEKTSEASA